MAAAMSGTGVLVSQEIATSKERTDRHIMAGLLASRAAPDGTTQAGRLACRQEECTWVAVRFGTAAQLPAAKEARGRPRRKGRERTKGEDRAMNKKEQEEGCCSPPFPEDFGKRLERLIELAGLSREEFAQRLGIDYDRVAQWFDGAVLTGGEVWHVARLAWSIPGGMGRPSCRRRPKARSSDRVRAAKRLMRRN